MLKEGRDGRDASIKRIVSAQRPVSGLPGRECAPLDLPFLFLRNCKQPSYYTKFPASLQGVPAGPFARGLRPLCAPNARRGCAPSSALLPMGRALRPSTPGDFPVAGKVTKGAPRAAPFGIPRCVVAALFALAALRSVSRRATFCHKNRPICHFGFVGKSVLFFSSSSTGGHTLYFQSVARQVGSPRGCLRV